MFANHGDTICATLQRAPLSMPGSLLVEAWQRHLPLMQTMLSTTHAMDQKNLFSLIFVIFVNQQPNKKKGKSRWSNGCGAGLGTAASIRSTERQAHNGGPNTEGRAHFDVWVWISDCTAIVCSNVRDTSLAVLLTNHLEELVGALLLIQHPSPNVKDGVSS